MCNYLIIVLKEIKGEGLEKEIYLTFLQQNADCQVVDEFDFAYLFEQL